MLCLFRCLDGLKKSYGKSVFSFPVFGWYGKVIWKECLFFSSVWIRIWEVKNCEVNYWNEFFCIFMFAEKITWEIECYLLAFSVKTKSLLLNLCASPTSQRSSIPDFMRGNILYVIMCKKSIYGNDEINHFSLRALDSPGQVSPLVPDRYPHFERLQS